ncbi:hypothetical protein AB0F20_10390 [Streptomyces goshikiensis]|uniref:hypothetical protein n=1 Tax=Streptomyces goshikiensis TaxID=1942 RepID=UPI0033C9A201
MQQVATRPQPVTTNAPAAVRPGTWWLVETRSGTPMLTLYPVDSWAPVNVWENGRMVPTMYRMVCDPAEHPDIPREVVPAHSARNLTDPAAT